MSTFILGVLALLSLLVGVPVIWFSAQVLAGLKPPSKDRRLAIGKQPPSVAVLIPAHNESFHLIPTLDSLKPLQSDTFRILVVADNCTDDTAEQARAHQVDVIERLDTRQRGKGYALDFGLAALRRKGPPQVVIVMDADCIPEPGAISRLARHAELLGRPVQALYLMDHPPDGLNGQIAQFAWRVKNWTRPRGLRRMGIGCQLTGTGMAFPWACIEKVSFATGHLVEDMQLGLALTEAGHAPVFDEHARVYSQFAPTAQAQDSQRTRWEHGHLSLILNTGLPIALRGLKNGQRQLLALGLDVCIPPLALLVLAVSGLALASSVIIPFIGPSTFVHGEAPAIHYALLLINWAWLALLTLSVVMAWRSVGREVLQPKALISIPVYVLRKVPLYLRYLVKKQSEWVRSSRDTKDT